ncbi:[citrate (pro-3S)-lyase] ligase [Propionivibrio limicola]|uniref:[citrate (pro-3S)-lyase] ligase n=1 Tax=Propionivibrio limicola TaxID=167645 RepID=UPI00129195D1|nr:[citrate (pro-3S)-lyase] ligase [Propionivibrio limicola]
MIVQLRTSSELKAARELIESSDLTYEEGFDAIIGIYEDEELIAVGTRSGNTLKMVAVSPAHQGGSVFVELVSALVMNGREAGYESLFVFTKAEYALAFESLNFTLLANQGRIVLLEYGKGLNNWLEANRSLLKSGVNGAVVVNCNPFTNGHRYLIESASKLVDNLYVFVVREDRSVFPFDVRFRLVKEGVRDLANVTVLDTSRYIVSSSTFPTYFLKKNDPISRIQMELDVTLFASKIAPFFNITKRFVGTEPNCPLTGGYNETMLRILPVYNIDLTVVERKQASKGVISASTVRELVGKNDMALLAEYVPPTTYAFLTSDEAAPIRERLQNDYRNKSLTGC